MKPDPVAEVVHDLHRFLDLLRGSGWKLEVGQYEAVARLAEQFAAAGTLPKDLRDWLPLIRPVLAGTEEEQDRVTQLFEPWAADLARERAEAARRKAPMEGPLETGLPVAPPGRDDREDGGGDVQAPRQRKRSGLFPAREGLALLLSIALLLAVVFWMRPRVRVQVIDHLGVSLPDALVTLNDNGYGLVTQKRSDPLGLVVFEPSALSDDWQVAAEKEGYRRGTGEVRFGGMKEGFLVRLEAWPAYLMRRFEQHRACLEARGFTLLQDAHAGQSNSRYQELAAEIEKEINACRAETPAAPIDVEGAKQELFALMKSVMTAGLEGEVDWASSDLLAARVERAKQSLRDLVDEPSCQPCAQELSSHLSLVRQELAAAVARNRKSNEPDLRAILRTLTELRASGFSYLSPFQRAYRRYYPWIRGLACFLLLGCFAIWLFKRLDVRGHFLLGRGADALPADEKIQVSGRPPPVFSLAELRRLAPRFRRPVAYPLYVLDAARTVQATVEQAGMFTPVYQTARTPREYLVLLHRSSLTDHQFRQFEHLLAALADYGVNLTTFTYANNPSLLQQRDKTVTLQELLGRYPDHQLLLFCDPGSLVDPMTGRLHQGCSLFEAWASRTVFTPLPTMERGYAEQALTDLGLPVVPVSAFSLAGYFGGPVANDDVDPLLSERPRIFTGPFPKLLRDRPATWIRPTAPRPREIESLVTQLRQFLDPPGMLWLTACAAYPVIQWELTLYLGKVLTDSEGASLLNVPRLGALGRLPWFREGWMPDWLRGALLAAAPEWDRSRIQAAIERLFNEPGKAGEGATLNIARRADTSRARRTAAEPLDSPLRDPVFFQAASGRKPVAMRWRLSKRWRAFLYPDGNPLFGMRPRWPGVLVGATVLAIWFLLPKPLPDLPLVPDFLPTVVQEGRILEAEAEIGLAFRGFEQALAHNRSALLADTSLSVADDLEAVDFRADRALYLAWLADQLRRRTFFAPSRNEWVREGDILTLKARLPVPPELFMSGIAGALTPPQQGEVVSFADVRVGWTRRLAFANPVEDLDALRAYFARFEGVRNIDEAFVVFQNAAYFATFVVEGWIASEEGWASPERDFSNFVSSVEVPLEGFAPETVMVDAGRGPFTTTEFVYGGQETVRVMARYGTFEANAEVRFDSGSIAQPTSKPFGSMRVFFPDDEQGTTALVVGPEGDAFLYAAGGNRAQLDLDAFIGGLVEMGWVERLRWAVVRSENSDYLDGLARFLARGPLAPDFELFHPNFDGLAARDPSTRYVTAAQGHQSWREDPFYVFKPEWQGRIACLDGGEGCGVRFKDFDMWLGAGWDPEQEDGVDVLAWGDWDDKDAPEVVKRYRPGVCIVQNGRVPKGSLDMLSWINLVSDIKSIPDRFGAEPKVYLTNRVGDRDDLADGVLDTVSWENGPKAITLQTDGSHYRVSGLKIRPFAQRLSDGEEVPASFPGLVLGAFLEVNETGRGGTVALYLSEDANYFGTEVRGLNPGPLAFGDRSVEGAPGYRRLALSEEGSGRYSLDFSPAYTPLDGDASLLNPAGDAIQRGSFRVEFYDGELPAESEESFSAGRLVQRSARLRGRVKGTQNNELDLASDRGTTTIRGEPPLPWVGQTVEATVRITPNGLVIPPNYYGRDTYGFVVVEPEPAPDDEPQTSPEGTGASDSGTSDSGTSETGTSDSGTSETGVGDPPTSIGLDQLGNYVAQRVAVEGVTLSPTAYEGIWKMTDARGSRAEVTLSLNWTREISVANKEPTLWNLAGMVQKQGEKAYLAVDNRSDVRKVPRERVSGSVVRNVFITEVMRDPGDSADTNDDGVVDALSDQFVEILNMEGQDLDLSGWMLLVNGYRWLRFREGAVLRQGEAAVVFGGKRVRRGPDIEYTTIAGLVVDAENRPLPGVAVEIVHEPLAISHVVFTDINGRYEWRKARIGGPYTISAYTPDYRREVRTEIDAYSGEIREVGFQMLTEEPESPLKARLTGRVVDVNRDPLPGVLMSFVHDLSGLTRNAVTRADGRYDVRLFHVDGSYTVTAAMTGFQTLRSEISLKTGETRELDFQMDPSEMDDEMVVTASRDIVVPMSFNYIADPVVPLNLAWGDVVLVDGQGREVDRTRYQSAEPVPGVSDATSGYERRMQHVPQTVGNPFTPGADVDWKPFLIRPIDDSREQGQ
ncbi:Carboxypeptidase regulatory-like domain-containing protein [Sulfidibacter corallicola]|uniref:Carboxypeptidase regulatory-like domain-containing protein n=1 Tax=Sulfidibacter corallicola TaxID=2818388 RepID=A0A8A4TR80_SULCO|nr:carboxypeptidase regulatory-like domain-containing protein [Sulfidibacter corallicola]QTD52479.1 carboxypeptidase regulatory-like domain-containing protein [Sulfidibacter corallicola]